MNIMNANGTLTMNSSQTADMLKTICTQEQTVNNTLYSLQNKDKLIPLISTLKTNTYNQMISCWNNASFVNQTIVNNLKSQDPTAYKNLLSVTGMDGSNKDTLMKTSFCLLANQTQGAINKFTTAEKAQLNVVFQGMFKCLNGTMPAMMKQLVTSNMGSLLPLMTNSNDFNKVMTLVKSFGVDPSKLMSMFK